MTSPPERLAVAVEPGPRRTRVHVSGEIDMNSSPEVREDLTAALDASPSGLDIDLAAVTFCDSSGLHVLLDLHHRAQEAGKTLVLSALSRAIIRLLHITGVQDLLTIQNPPDSPPSGSLRPAQAEGQPGPLPARNFQMKTSRYGPTAYLAPVGELDLDTRPALDRLQEELDEADVVACDVGKLTFLDVVGLHGLLDLARRLDERGIAFFAYNWQPQPRRLLDLIDSLIPSADRRRPTRLLRRLQDFAAAAQTAGAAKAQQHNTLRAAQRPPH
ncbi:STAS domain-containing protein [Streptomyces sp. NPDC004311]|uniref:STAS domain-containing protein n=1 Tax=Streptomyces sp. NPDC004311 TaxID=3364698 RepID=UPI0036781B0F